MSRFIEQQQIGDPIVLELVDRPEPRAQAGEVRVRVSAAGLNPVDWKIASNPDAAARFGVTVPTGFGNDFAGVVDEIGDGVTGFAVGDRVFGGARGGAVADHVVLPVDGGTIARTPDGLDDATASAVWIAARTADAAVHAARVAAGDTVLIGGAAGGVGVLTVQLAVAAGATVIATASEQNHAFLRELGAIPVAYGEGLVEAVRAAAVDAVSAAIDLYGTTTVEAAVALGVAPDRIATIAAGPNPPHGAVATGGVDAAPEAASRIAQLLADGTFVLPVTATFPVERIDEAIALQRAGHVRGKVVVTL